jgi:predicted RNA-binding Zn-ribbon protein involved in translation (DUF1610 family)
MSEHERGGVLECGECRKPLIWVPHEEVYACPNCGWEK